METPTGVFVVFLMVLMWCDIVNSCTKPLKIRVRPIMAHLSIPTGRSLAKPLSPVQDQSCYMFQHGGTSGLGGVLRLQSRPLRNPYVNRENPVASQGKPANV